MSSDYILRALCPGKEFGLEDCETHVYTRGYTTYGGYFDPPETVEEEEYHTDCDCLEQIEKRGNLDEVRKYHDRVWELLSKAEPEADYPDRDYD